MAATRAVRLVEVEFAEGEDAATTFARDALAMLRVADEQVARMRVWRRQTEGLSFGRFHRVGAAGGASSISGSASGSTSGSASGSASGSTSGSASGFASAGTGTAAGDDGVSRRLCGGRIVPVGPAVVCITLVVPVVDWLDPGAASLKPEQVLNRALRPLLALLRADGLDVVYPGRDLVTMAGRAIAHASFTVSRDGTCVVEMHVAEEPSFAGLAALLDRSDPDAVAGTDRAALAGATSLEQHNVARRSNEEWARRLVTLSASTFGCEARPVGEWNSNGPADVTMASAEAAAAFVREIGPAPDGAATAATVSMLGMVECSAGRRGDRITGLAITGDLIAPFHTIDDIACECEDEPLRPANIRKALARALARPRSFVLGLRDLDELIARLA
ncbi:MAG TPA: hypothetical protein VGK20_06715 [Candidatus Binatia bacterium]